MVDLSALSGSMDGTARKMSLENNALSTYRGLKNEMLRKTFQRPLRFGQFCNRYRNEWDWIAASENPFAFDAKNPYHFCHFFFQYAMQQQYDTYWTREGSNNFLAMRDVQITRCSNLDDSHCRLLTLDGKECDMYDGVTCFRYSCGYMDLCSDYWVTQKSLGKGLPYAEGDLIRMGYLAVQFLYRGSFAMEFDDNGKSVGLLMTSSCQDSDARNFMEKSKAETWSEFDDPWDTFGAMGYARWKNFDYDIIKDHELKLRPVNMPLDMLNVLETSARLRQEDGRDKHSPVLISTSRPNSIFQRHKYRHDEEWGNYSGEEFQLAKVQLPAYDRTCDAQRTTIR